MIIFDQNFLSLENKLEQDRFTTGLKNLWNSVYWLREQYKELVSSTSRRFWKKPKIYLLILELATHVIVSIRYVFGQFNIL